MHFPNLEHFRQKLAQLCPIALNSLCLSNTMATWIWISIVAGNGLLPHGSKPLPGPMMIKLERFMTVVTSYLVVLRIPEILWKYIFSLSHYIDDGVSNYQPHSCLLNRLFRRRSKKKSKLRVTGLCARNSPGPVNSPHKWPVTRKMFPFDDVIM